MNRLIPLLALLIAATPLAAQTTAIHVTGGVNVATFSIPDANPLPDTESITRPNVGLGVVTPVVGLFEVEAGASFSGKGAQTTIVSPGIGRFAVGIDAEYIDFHLFGRVSRPVGRRASFYMGLGPFLSFNTSCDVEARGVVDGVSITMDDSCEDVALDLDVGTDFGAALIVGFDVPLTDRIGATAGTGYFLGLSDLDPSADTDMMNRVWMIRTGLRYSW